MTISARQLKTLQWHRDGELKKAFADFNLQLEYTPVKIALEWWVENLKESKSLLPETIAENFANITALIENGIIRETWDIGTLDYNHRFINDLFKEYTKWNSTKKSKLMNSLISFTNYLRHESQGKFRKFQPPQDIKLEHQIRANSPSALTLQQWWEFRDILEKISKRDALVAKFLLNTARPLYEILNIKISDLNFTKNLVVTFTKKGVPTGVQLDSSLQKETQEYIKESAPYRKNGTDLLFVTNQGNPIFRTHFTQTFKKAGLKADLGFTVSSKMIQWSHVSDMLHRMQLSKEQVKEILKIKSLPKI